MTDLISEPADATPLTEAERQGLLVPALTRAELNRAEAENIGRAMSWLFLSHRRLRPQSVTDEEWLKRLHRRMYGEVWAWAGRYRAADRNLGVPYWQVRVDMRNLLDDARAWLADITASRTEATNARSGSDTGSWSSTRLRTATAGGRDWPRTHWSWRLAVPGSAGAGRR
jgi:fido (protein-threonine AMPylation protein)